MLRGAFRPTPGGREAGGSLEAALCILDSQRTEELGEAGGGGHGLRKRELVRWSVTREVRTHAFRDPTTWRFGMSFVYGPPPKVIWVRLGNCSTEQVDELLKLREAEIRDFRERTRTRC